MYVGDADYSEHARQCTAEFGGERIMKIDDHMATL